jgi:DNA-binding transcriptional LysR family regulator
MPFDSVMPDIVARGDIKAKAELPYDRPSQAAGRLLAGHGERITAQLRQAEREAAIAIPAGDVCVEFPSVLALVAAGRGAAIVPQMAFGQTPVTVCTLPPLGGRHIAAWYPAGPAQPTPATATVLDTLAQAGQDTTASATAH